MSSEDLPSQTNPAPKRRRKVKNLEIKDPRLIFNSIWEELEKDLVVQALARTGNNQTRAARLLGMTRDQIRYRVEKFGLDLKGEDAGKKG